MTCNLVILLLGLYNYNPCKLNLLAPDNVHVHFVLQKIGLVTTSAAPACLHTERLVLNYTAVELKRRQNSNPFEIRVGDLQWSDPSENMISAKRDSVKAAALQDFFLLCLHCHKIPNTSMWANAKRDGHPAEYRWRPLFNAAKFRLRPLLECCAVTLPRRETR